MALLQLVRRKPRDTLICLLQITIQEQQLLKGLKGHPINNIRVSVVSLESPHHP